MERKKEKNPKSVCKHIKTLLLRPSIHLGCGICGTRKKRKGCGSRYNAEEENGFSTELLHTMKHMVCFGFLATQKQLEDIIRTLLKLADGRTDVSG